jgi:hypothetical protein
MCAMGHPIRSCRHFNCQEHRSAVEQEKRDRVGPTGTLQAERLRSRQEPADVSSLTNLTTLGTVKLLDFGIARKEREKFDTDAETASHESDITEGSLVGTPSR